MPKFTIEHESANKPEEAYIKIKDFLSNDQDLRRFDAKLDCKFDDSDLSCKLNGSQFKADVKIDSTANGSRVFLLVDLPLLMTPFKSKVQETLQKKLTKYLG